MVAVRAAPTLCLTRVAGVAPRDGLGGGRGHSALPPRLRRTAGGAAVSVSVRLARPRAVPLGGRMAADQPLVKCAASGGGRGMPAPFPRGLRRPTRGPAPHSVTTRGASLRAHASYAADPYGRGDAIAPTLSIPT
jgi:hypothetical protein